MKGLLTTIRKNHVGLPLPPIQYFSQLELEAASIPRVAWDGSVAILLMQTPNQYKCKN
jgi:hypothetical protein